MLLREYMTVFTIISILYCPKTQHLAYRGNVPLHSYGDSPVNHGIPFTYAIRKKAIFHTFFQFLIVIFSVNVHDVLC